MWKKYSNDPTTWHANQLKEWLAEHEITYKGILEKHDLIELVKSNFNSSYNNNEPKTQSNAEAISSHVSSFITYIGESLNYTKELTEDELSGYSQKIADKIENLRRLTGLSEDQLSPIFDEINSQLKSTKTNVNKNLTNALNEIERSYNLAKARRDVLIQKSSNLIQQDIHNYKSISNDTIEWFKSEFNQSTNNIAKARVLPQLTLVIHGIQEELFNRNVLAQESLEELSEKLTSAVKSTLPSYGDYKKSFISTLGHIGHELIKTIGGYKLLTQEKIQNALDNINQKYYDGKSLTLEQYRHIKNIFSKYFNGLLSFFSSVTNKIRGKGRETVETVDYNTERSVNYIKNYFDDLIKNQKNYRNQKIDQLLDVMINQVSSTQKLTNEQLEILFETLKDKQGPFKNTKSVKDVTEDKINAYITLLRDRFKTLGEKIGDTKDKVGEKIIDTKDKVSEKIIDTKDQVGQKIFDTKDQITKKVDDYRKEL
ncbi:17210_t:CDS:2 [Entrophospora sp. SA101]|nr:17210_t:CDS:2 [Entrophospora sp. SA101]